MSDQDKKRQEMLDKIQNRKDEEKTIVPDDESDLSAVTNDSGEIDKEFIRKCFDADELGDSLLYNRLHRGQFICNEISEDWMKYVGPHWEIDYMQSDSKAAIENVVGLYLEHILAPVLERLEKLDEGEDGYKEQKKMIIAQRKIILSRITTLRRNGFRNSLLKSAVSNGDPIKIGYKDLDTNPYLFPTKNGVYDLEHDKFTPGGDPEHYITVECPTTYDVSKKSKCPEWEKYISEILGDDEEVVRYMQQVLGYSMSGLQEEHIFIVLYGPHGRNGKGTLINVLSKVVGPLVSKINTELLMDQRFGRSANAPSPEIMDIKGKRIIWSSETKKGASFAHDQVKVFSGGDPLKGRGLNDKPMTQFDPTHLLFLLCNDLPKAPPDDDAFWARLRVITFLFSYQDECTEKHHKPVDKKLMQRLIAEAPGILQWLFDGFADWRENGMQTPKKVLKDSLNYRQHEDDLQEWMDTNCSIDKEDHAKTNRTSSTLLYGNFYAWWEANNPGERCMNKKDFSNQLQAKGFKKVKSGAIHYQYIMLIVPVGN